jgi:hypothetical protein
LGGVFSPAYTATKKQRCASSSLYWSDSRDAMIESPFEYALSPEELQKLAKLFLTWSHTEQLVGQTLATLLRLRGDEAIIMVYPLALEQRLRRLKELAALNPMTDHMRASLEELLAIMPAVQLVRNNVTHAVLIHDTRGELLFHLSSKDRTLTRAQIFESEELMNYACNVAMSLRFSLPTAAESGWHRPLLERPAIPDFLRHLIPIRKK